MTTTIYFPFTSSCVSCDFVSSEPVSTRIFVLALIVGVFSRENLRLSLSLKFCGSCAVLCVAEQALACLRFLSSQTKLPTMKRGRRTSPARRLDIFWLRSQTVSATAKKREKLKRRPHLGTLKAERTREKKRNGEVALKEHMPLPWLPSRDLAFLTCVLIHEYCGRTVKKDNTEGNYGKDRSLGIVPRNYNHRDTEEAVHD